METNTTTTERRVTEADQFGEINSSVIHNSQLHMTQATKREWIATHIYAGLLSRTASVKVGARQAVDYADNLLWALESLPTQNTNR